MYHKGYGGVYRICLTLIDQSIKEHCEQLLSLHLTCCDVCC